MLFSGPIQGYIALAAVFSFVFLCFFFLQFKWSIFAYRIITTHRVALVITKRYLVFSPGVICVYFQDTMDNLSNGQNSSPQFAMVEYGNENGDGEGTATIYGKEILIFGHVNNILLLEGIYFCY